MTKRSCYRGPNDRTMHPTRAPARRRRNPYNTCHVATPMIIIDITIAATSQHWVRLLLSLVLALVLVLVFVFVVCTCIFTRTCSCIFSSRASTITQARYGAPPRVRQGQPTPNEAFACDHGARAWPQSHDARVGKQVPLVSFLIPTASRRTSTIRSRRPFTSDVVWVLGTRRTWRFKQRPQSHAPAECDAPTLPRMYIARPYIMYIDSMTTHDRRDPHGTHDINE